MKPFFFACRAAAARRALATGFVVGLALCGALASQGAQGYERHILAISGTPASTVLVGQNYSFTPSAHDARDRTLIFAIANKPAWATFSASSGQLSGTPSAANVGAYADIVIAVSDGRRTATL
ncbi:MAG: putative Ig domain-containing protein, partial [Steroidobacteraceae bacterium]